LRNLRVAELSRLDLLSNSALKINLSALIQINLLLTIDPMRLAASAGMIPVENAPVLIALSQFVKFS